MRVVKMVRMILRVVVRMMGMMEMNLMVILRVVVRLGILQIRISLSLV